MYPDNLTQIFFSLITSIIIAIPVYLHYRKSTKPAYEKYHTFWPRFFAPYFDQLLFWPLTGLLFIVLLLLNTPPKTLALISFFIGILRLVYRIYFTGRFGQTIGKMLSKVKVVDAKTGEDISYKQAILRNIDEIAVTLIGLAFFPQFIFFTKADYEHLAHSQSFKIITAALIVWAIANIVVFFSNEKRRAIHDYIAGTVVVRTNVVGADIPPNYEEFEPLIPREKKKLETIPRPYY